MHRLAAGFTNGQSVPSGSWMIWMDTVHREEVLGDGLLRPSQCPSIEPDEAQTIAYIYTPDAAGGGDQVPIRMQRLINPETPQVYEDGNQANEYYNLPRYIISIDVRL